MTEWQRIKDIKPPQGEMFIWAAAKDEGGWSIGLAYWTVSGTFADAYGYRELPSYATHWMPLPAPPET